MLRFPVRSAIIFLLAVMLIGVVPIGAAADITLNNNLFSVVIGSSSGAITSLKRPGDIFPTDYVWAGQSIGSVLTKYRIPPAGWITGETSSSADVRTISHPDANTVVVSYLNNSANANGIKNIQIQETYQLQGDSLVWTIRFKNKSTSYVTLGDVGLPLRFATDYNLDTPTIFTTQTIRHGFVSGDNSYITCLRPNGVGPYLVMTPLPGTHLEYYKEANYNYVAYIHAVVQSAIGDPGSTWRQPITSRQLAAAGNPGDEVTYGFKFKWASDYDGVRDTLVEEGLVDVQVVPGMVVPQDMSTMLSLRTKQVINSVTAEFPTNTTITYLGKKDAFTYLYSVQFYKLGENEITINFGNNRKGYLEFFCTQPVETLIKKRANFIRTKQQWKSSNRWYEGLFSVWDMKNKVKRSPDDTAGLWPYIVGGSDDPSNCKAPYLAEKNASFPVQSEIDAIEYHLQKFVWGGLQRKDTETPYPYGIYGIDNWYVNRNSTQGFGSGGGGKEHLWRPYDYPTLVNLYYNMYRIAKAYPTMTKYLDAAGYLDRAFNTAKAYFVVPYSIQFSNGLYWNGAYTLGCYHEPTFPKLIDDLIKEGRAADAAWLRAEWEKKVKYFVYDDPYPWGSEYAFDSTAYETTHIIAKYGLNNTIQPDTNLWQDKNTGHWYSHPSVNKADFAAFMEKQMEANVADRGWLEPAYYLLGSDIRGTCNTSYTMTYMTQLGGWSVLDYALHYATDPEKYMRLGYASYLCSWGLINAGDAASNYGFFFPGPENDGAAGWAFEPMKVGTPWYQQPQGRGLWTYDGEIDHGFMGGLRSAASILVNDPMFGLYAYGGTVTANSNSFTLVPNDGIRQRVHLMNVAPALHMELNIDGFTSVQATIAQDRSIRYLSLVLENRSLDAHSTTINTEGLPAGDYDIKVDGTSVGISHVSGGVNVPIVVTAPANASYTVEIIPQTLLSGVVTDAAGVPIPNAAVQIGGFGGPAAVTDQNGSYTVRVPSIGKQVLFADALGYKATYSTIVATSSGGMQQNITLAPATEVGVVVNGSFESNGGWSTVLDQPTGNDYLGNAWPAANADMYFLGKDTIENQTIGGTACGSFRTGSAVRNPGVLGESAQGSSGVASALTSTVLTVSDKAWTSGQWAGYDLILTKTGTQAVTKRYWITASTANTVTISAADMVADGFSAGVAYKIVKHNYLYSYPGRMSQWVEVSPDSRYSFYFKGKLSTDIGAFWMLKWADANHNEICRWVDPRSDGNWQERGEWEQQLNGSSPQLGIKDSPMLQITPPAGAKYVEIGFGFTSETKVVRNGKILVDDVVFDKITSPDIADAKDCPDGTPIVLTGKTVTLAPRNASGVRNTQFFYIENDDRSAAIRVQCVGAIQDSVRVGDIATINGTMQTIPGTNERYVELSAVPGSIPGGSIKPLGMTTKVMQSDDNALAQLVTVAAKVTDIAQDGKSFSISDGYGQGSTKVIVDSVPLAGQFKTNDFVVINGVVSMEMSGSAPIRVIRFRELKSVIISKSAPLLSWITGLQPDEACMLGAIYGAADKKDQDEYVVCLNAEPVGRKEL